MIYDFPLFPISDSIRWSVRKESERSPAAEALVYQDETAKNEGKRKSTGATEAPLLMRFRY